MATTTLPTSIFEVTYSDIDDERQDTAFYSEAKATARCEQLNRDLWAEDRRRWAESRDWWAPFVATMTDEHIGRADAAMVAAYATDKAIRREAREVLDAFPRSTIERDISFDPRGLVEYAEAMLAQSFDEWMEESPDAKWRVSAVPIEDAGAFDG